MAAIPDWQSPFRHPGAHRATPVETVALPVDASAASRGALPVARRLAQLYGAILHILYVGEPFAGPRETLQELGISPEQVRGTVLDRLAGDGKEILEALQRLPSSLLVMSTQTGNPAGDTLLGSVAEFLLNSNLPRVVLVAPEQTRSEWQVNHVLLAHDGAPSTDAATAEAAELAHRAGADVLAIHVAARTAPDVLEPGSIPAPRYIDQPQHEWPAWANEFLDRMMALGTAPGKVRFKLMVTGGQPGSEIADFARENHFDLVVAGWHGGWDTAHRSALDVILRRGGCPVLLVYAPEAHR